MMVSTQNCVKTKVGFEVFSIKLIAFSKLQVDEVSTEKISMAKMTRTESELFLRCPNSGSRGSAVKGISALERAAEFSG